MTGGTARINTHIQRGLDELSASLRLSQDKEKLNYYSNFKIRLKPTSLPSALKPISVKSKYRKFDGSYTDKSDGSYGPTGATGMDSYVGGGVSSSPGEGGAMGGGFGVDSFGVTAFGESINKTKSRYLEFVNKLNDAGEYSESNVLETVVAGYKALFDSIETETNVIMCGIQPSMASHFRFSIDKLVFALNTFNGNVLSIYIGGNSDLESLDIIKKWYLDIGVKSSVIDRITFVEKSTPIPDASAFEYELTPSEHGLNSPEAMHEFCDSVESAILLGCADVYFIGELMLEYTKLQKHIDIDTNFIFMV